MKRPGIGWYARTVLHRKLYPYQEEIGDAIIDSVLGDKGITFTCMLARQMGKNEISAIVESYLLSCMDSGTIIKGAPTFKPQVINSRLRLLSILENPLTADHVWRSFGYMIGVARNKREVRAQTGPRVMFFSASPESNIVGATASLLLEIDEAQDIAVDKFNRDLRPMASTKNTTTVLYGTAWTDDTLLAMVRANNLALEQQDGIKRHFEYDWRALAAINPHYKRFVEAEIARLGEDHLTIRTQYNLQPISGAGFLLSDMQHYLLRGSHDWEHEPNDTGDIYLLGMDVGGEERPKAGDEMKLASKRDSTIITVGRVSYNEFALPKLEIVHQYWFTGMHHSDQYAATCEIMRQWNVRRLVIDATGLGEALASLLTDKFGEQRITPFKFSRPSKSKLTYQFLSMINSGRLKMYKSDKAPTNIHHEVWKQLRLARYRVPGEELIDMFVPVGEGHDDMLMSIALCCEAIREFTAPVQESLIVRPRRLYADEQRY
jgi:hypothetical protein